MISPAQNPEEKSFALPARLILLGEALQSVAQAARQSLTNRVRCNTAGAARGAPEGD
jgi:hypothetical protein